MNSLQGVYAKVANEIPNLYPQTSIALAKDVFKVASLYAPIARHLSDDEMSEMHSKALGDNFTLIPATIELHSVMSSRNFITSLVRANIISQPFDEKQVRASMKVISANVFMDDENHIWKVVGKGETARLVQSKKEDFAAILNERINSQQNMILASCTPAEISQHDTENGDFVLYFSPASQEMDTGLAFTTRDKYAVFSYGLREWEEVSTHNIVRAAVIDRKVKASPFSNSNLGEDLVGNSGEFTNPLRRKYLDYMKFLYDGTDYFKKLTDLVNLRTQTGNSHLPLSCMR